MHGVKAVYCLCQTKTLNKSFRNAEIVPFFTKGNLFLKLFLVFSLSVDVIVMQTLKDIDFVFPTEHEKVTFFPVI